MAQEIMWKSQIFKKIMKKNNSFLFNKLYFYSRFWPQKRGKTLPAGSRANLSSPIDRGKGFPLQKGLAFPLILARRDLNALCSKRANRNHMDFCIDAEAISLKTRSAVAGGSSTNCRRGQLSPAYKRSVFRPNITAKKFWYFFDKKYIKNMKKNIKNLILKFHQKTASTAVLVRGGTGK